MVQRAFLYEFMALFIIIFVFFFFFLLLFLLFLLLHFFCLSGLRLLLCSNSE
jgi:hypothetical protein